MAPSRTNFLLAEADDAARVRTALLDRGFAVRGATSFGLPSSVRIAVPAEAEMDRLIRALGEVLAGMR